MTNPQIAPESKALEDSNETRGFILKLLSFIKDHYASLTSILLLIFISTCLFLSISFYRHFGIEITYFSSFLDIYKAALSNDAWLNVALFLFFLAFTVFAWWSQPKVKPPHSDSKIQLPIILIPSNKSLPLLQRIGKLAATLGKWQIENIIALAAAFVAVLIIAILPSAVTARANLIKGGYTSRYEVRTIDSVYNCHAMLGASSDHVFLWNFETRHPTIIPRLKINEIKTVFDAPAQVTPLTRILNSSEDIAKHKQAAKDALEKWKQDLYATCKQKVAPGTY